MVYNGFGRISDSVSRFGMGCMRLPRTKDEKGNDVIDEEESIGMIRYAIEKGVNYFDTAYAYEGSEKVLGKALKGGYREKVMIATKCPMYEIKEYGDYQRVFDESLRRLDTEYIDVYLFHCLDRKTWEKVKSTNGIAFMEDMKRQGKIRAIAFSFHAEYELFIEIIDAYDWVMVPNVYGMSQNADGGLITTKPYISGSSYVLKMSRFRKGNWCPIWDALYWRFIHKHQEFFAANPRMSVMAVQCRKMGIKLDAHLKTAESFLEHLHHR